jgi:hypothetical protein
MHFNFDKFNYVQMNKFIVEEPPKSPEISIKEIIANYNKKLDSLKNSVFDLHKESTPETPKKTLS